MKARLCTPYAKANGTRTLKSTNSAYIERIILKMKTALYYAKANGTNYLMHGLKKSPTNKRKKETKMKTKIDTTFSEALSAMKTDHTVRCKRFGWDYNISRHYIEENDFITEPFFIVAVGDDGYGVWTPTNADLFANDRMIELTYYSVVKRQQ